MYSMKLEDDDRIIVQCNAKDGSFLSFDCIYDTGARYTALPIKTLTPKASINESEITKNECKILEGFVTGERVEFYKYHLSSFAVGNVLLGSQDVWVALDEKIKTPVLGMDIIKQLFAITEYGNLIIFRSKDELISYCNGLIKLGVF